MTTQALSLFNYLDHQVRVLDFEGEPWFVLADLCRVLEIANPSNVASRLDPGVMNTVRLAEGNRGNPNVTAVSEAGMYEVIIRSDKPEAAAFRRWITTEVLPSIRKHGGYLTPEATEAALTDPDFIIRLATDLKQERAKRAELQAKVAADQPKVLFADAVATSKSTCLVGELAKILCGNGYRIGATRLFRILREKGYLISRAGSDWNMPTQKSMELALFEVKETAITHSDGHVTVSRTPKVTGKGQQYFVDRFLAGRFTEPDAA